MKDKKPIDELAPLGCATLVRAHTGRVGITTSKIKLWNGLDVRSRVRLKRIMSEWCEGRQLPYTMYKRGGRYGRTPGGATISVFKSGQVRLYGFERHLDGIRTFIIADCDPVKKQDDADRDLMARLKVRIDAFGKEN